MLSGLLIIDKPLNKTSHDIVASVRRCLKIKKVGHFGTLDPLADGVLLIAIGRATKFFDFYLKKKKTYTGEIKFGHSTTTYDQEGEINSKITQPDLEAIDLKPIIESFLGKQSQIPPIYSAKKVKGKALYKYAREDKKVKIKPSEVEIYSFEHKIIDKSTLWFRVCVSSGTYIRSIAYDMGIKTGLGAYLSQLTREKVGDFSLNDAIPFELIELNKTEEVKAKILDFNKLLPNFSSIEVSGEVEKGVLNGREIQEDQVIKKTINEEQNLFRVINKKGIILSIAKKDEILKVYKSFLVFN